MKHLLGRRVNLRHYRSFRRNRRLHRAICKCRGYGFRYHVLGWRQRKIRREGQFVGELR